MSRHQAAGRPDPTQEADRARVAGIEIAWDVERGTCTFEGLPVAMMWVDTTLMGLMSGVQAMVGTERFALAQQAEGRRSVEDDWKVISACRTFAEGFDAIATIAAVAGWGVWRVVDIDADQKTCRFRVWNSWEGRFQRALGVCWGSGMLAGKLAGYCSKLFATNCWATQTASIARGDAFDEFDVAPSALTIESELEGLLATDEATRADMAVALAHLRREIEDRQRAEATLREREAQYRAIVEDQTELICRFLPDGTVTFANQAYCRYFGVSEDEVLGRGFAGRIPDEDRGAVAAHFAAFSPTRPVATHEHRVLSADGSIRWNQWTNRALFDGDRIVEFQGAGRDVTERRRAEDERAALEDQLRQSQKMEAIGRLAGGVAHDFNNILTAVAGYAELLERDLAEPHLRASAREIRLAGERASRLTTQLLAFSRKQLIRPEVIGLDEVLTNLQGMLARIIGEDVRLVFRPGARDWRVRADPAQLDQVLINLAVNARQAMPGGGELLIETAQRRASEIAPDRGSLASGEYVTLVVADTGAGMDDATQERMFEPFFSTREGTGTGLGLSTVYGIVQQNDGMIEVESAPGQGTTFRIHLPRELAATVQPAPPTAGRPATGAETVLVAEDDHGVRALVRQMLSLQGYQVIEGDSGQQALEAADAWPGTIHLLVTDVVMPHMTGRDVYERLRQDHPALRVVYMSGYPNDVIAQRGVLSPDMHFVPKPFTSDVLLAKVREALDAPGAGTPGGGTQ